MTAIRELAPAKINLTLEVLGRRDDRLHEIASLVAFADIGDVVLLDRGAAPALSVSGPFAGQLTGDNILSRAVREIEARAPGFDLGAIHLDKQLPVAAGIGGGSADAGALIRIMRRLPAAALATDDWDQIARSLGSDVPVCVEAAPAWMTGTGTEIAPLPDGSLPVLHAVLINPLAEVPADKTARVYKALAAPALDAGYARPEPPRLADRAALLAFMVSKGNDLAGAAAAVVPQIHDVLAALTSAQGREYAAVSGGGPTCFGIFPDQEHAQEACRAIAARRPAWWVVATKLR